MSCHFPSFWSATMWKCMKNSFSLLLQIITGVHFTWKQNLKYTKPPCVDWRVCGTCSVSFCVCCAFGVWPIIAACSFICLMFCSIYEGAVNWIDILLQLYNNIVYIVRKKSLVVAQMRAMKVICCHRRLYQVCTWIRPWQKSIQTSVLNACWQMLKLCIHPSPPSFSISPTCNQQIRSKSRTTRTCKYKPG